MNTEDSVSTCKDRRRMRKTAEENTKKSTVKKPINGYMMFYNFRMP